MPGPVDTTVVVVAVFLTAAAVFAVRRLRLAPAPPFRWLRLRRRGLELLAPAPPRVRLQRAWIANRGRFAWMRFVVYLGVLLGLGLLPWDLRVGPFDSDAESAEFLRTLWQVVAAALGVSVAMVAFAFEAFSGSGQRAYGGSLREFAEESRLLLIIEIGLLSLLFDGVVLLGWGHNAPRGLPAMWAIAISVLTLVGVGYVMHRVVRLLDDASLLKMRAARVRRLVDRAMTEQLIGQAADHWLHRSGLPVQRTLGNPGGVAIPSRRAGSVADIRVGPLARAMVALPGAQIWLPISLGDTIRTADPVLFVSGVPSVRRRRSLASAVRVRSVGFESADRALTQALDRLHQQGMDAARNGRELEWRAISELYELVLLALPKAAASWGVPFAGAVMAPGFFGFGPVQRIAGFLYDELVAAVDSNSRELIGPITYFPQHVAVEATRLGAPAIAHPLLQLYPSMYLAAIRGRP